MSAQPGDQQQGEATLLWLLGQGASTAIRPSLQGSSAQAVPPSGSAVHRKEVPLPHPRDGLLHLPAYPACSRWPNCKASKPRYSGGHNEVLLSCSAGQFRAHVKVSNRLTKLINLAGTLGQGFPITAAAPR